MKLLTDVSLSLSLPSSLSQINNYPQVRIKERERENERERQTETERPHFPHGDWGTLNGRGGLWGNWSLIRVGNPQKEKRYHL